MTQCYCKPVSHQERMQTAEVALGWRWAMQWLARTIRRGLRKPLFAEYSILIVKFIKSRRTEAGWTFAKNWSYTSTVAISTLLSIGPVVTLRPIFFSFTKYEIISIKWDSRTASRPNRHWQPSTLCSWSLMETSRKIRGTRTSRNIYMFV